MNDEKRRFVHRILWLIVPGIVSGMITGGIAYGTIQTTMTYMQRDIARNRKINQQQQVNITRLQIQQARDESTNNTQGSL